MYPDPSQGATSSYLHNAQTQYFAASADRCQNAMRVPLDASHSPKRDFFGNVCFTVENKFLSENFTPASHDQRISSSSSSLKQFEEVPLEQRTTGSSTESSVSNSHQVSSIYGQRRPDSSNSQISNGLVMQSLSPGSSSSGSSPTPQNSGKH